MRAMWAWTVVLRWSLVSFAFLSAPPCHASPPLGPPIRVLLRACAQMDQSEVERVVSAELGAEVAPEPSSADPTWILAKCEDNRVFIEVTDAVSRKTLRRSFNLAASPRQARARLVAIAASELVLASWSELALHPTLRVQPEGAAPGARTARAAAARARAAAVPRPSASPPRAETSAEEEESRPRRGRRDSWLALQPPEERWFRIVPLGSARSFLDYDGWLVGGGLRVGEEPLAHTSWALDTLFESGTIPTSKGDYHIDTWTLGATLYVYQRSETVTVRGGAGLRGGIANSSSAANGTFSRIAMPWGWPMLAIGFTAGHPILLEVSLEASYAALRVEPSASGLTVRGVWLALQAGVGYSL